MNNYCFDPDLFEDIPTPYAVFKVLLAEDGKSVENTQYVYVNQSYCLFSGCCREDLIGRRFLDVYQKGDARWLDYCWQAVTTGQAIHAADNAMYQDKEAYYHALKPGVVVRG